MQEALVGIPVWIYLLSAGVPLFWLGCVTIALGVERALSGDRHSGLPDDGCRYTVPGGFLVMIGGWLSVTAFPPFVFLLAGLLMLLAFGFMGLLAWRLAGPIRRFAGRFNRKEGA